MWRLPLMGSNAEVLSTAMPLEVAGLVLYIINVAYVNTLLLGHNVAT